MDVDVEDSVSSSAQPTYTVVARRYRPKSFGELIGQEHVAHALSTAIASGRVGHAYLFTGARGVGKTSTARIFAKALSIPDESSPELEQEISSAVDAGEDIDVIEIDGASNRGVDEIRQLRANVHARPARARYKIYIIDEVHMLTGVAFNALLKTLEEPPEHVKFIFCTTDPEKLPITVLSRCQRFDFVPVKFDAIQQRLQEIAEAEGYQIEPDALALLARRAAGSMRDSQSLLEQVMSFSTGTITTGQVHSLMGTADEGNLLAIVQALFQRDALLAFESANQTMSQGADSGQLAEQLLNYLRDLMAVGIGGGPDVLKVANPVGHAQLQQLAQSWGVQSILSAIQILDETLVRMRSSISATTLLEVALVQICQLEHLASIPALLEALGSSGTAVDPQKKKLPQPTSSLAESLRDLDGGVSTGSDLRRPQDGVINEPEEAATVMESSAKEDSPTLQTPEVRSASLPVNQPENSQANTAATEITEVKRFLPTQETDESTRASTDDLLQPETLTKYAEILNSPESLEIWRRATGKIEGLVSEYCNLVVAVEPVGSAAWRIIFPPGAQSTRDYCEQPVRKKELSQALAGELGREVRLILEVQPGSAPVTPAPAISSSTERTRKMRELAGHPLVKKLCELLDAEIVKVHPAQTSKVPHSGNARGVMPAATASSNRE